MYSALRLGFGRSSFDVSEAEAKVKLGRPETRLALSKLSSAGWVVRLARGRYLALEPEFVFASLGKQWADDLAGQGVFACLQAAVAALFDLYNERLVSIALFGSSARHTSGVTSDVDLLVVADGLSGVHSERLEELEPVQEACATVRRAQWPASGEYHPLDLVVLSKEELRENSLFLLDLTRDAVLIYDREGTLGGALEELRRRLTEAGSRRVETQSGAWYWELSPRAKAGERVAI